MFSSVYWAVQLAHTAKEILYFLLQEMPFLYLIQILCNVEKIHPSFPSFYVKDCFSMEKVVLFKQASDQKCSSCLLRIEASGVKAMNT